MSEQYEEASGIWYRRCVEKASQHDSRSWRHAFWWSLRFELDSEGIRRWANDPERAVREWVEYFHYKLETVVARA